MTDKTTQAHVSESRHLEDEISGIESSAQRPSPKRLPKQTKKTLEGSSKAGPSQRPEDVCELTERGVGEGGTSPA